MQYRVHFQVFLFCWFGISLTAQLPTLHFRQFTVADGLSSNTVYSIRRDSYGYMWFCTSRGLDRYDGKNFEHYRSVPGESATLPDMAVLQVEEDSKRNLWIRTKKCLSYLERATNRMSHYPFDILETNYSFLLLEKEQRIYLNTVMGVYYFDLECREYQVFTPPVLPPTIDPKNLMIYDENMLFAGKTPCWFSSDLGKTYVRFSDWVDENPEPNFINFNKKDSILWYAFTWAKTGHDWMRYDLKTKRKTAYPIDLKDFSSWIFISPDRLLITGQYSGLRDIDLKTGQINFYTNQRDSRYFIEDPAGFINPYYDSLTQTIWVAGFLGVFYASAQEEPVRQIHDGISGFEDFPGSEIECAAQDEAGNYWFGMLSYGNLFSGLVKYDVRQDTFFTFAWQNPPHKDFNRIWYILPLAADTFLLSTQRGLAFFNPQTSEFHRRFPAGFPHLKTFINGFTHLLRDKQGRLFFAPWLGGIYQYEPDTDAVHHYPSKTTFAQISLDSDNRGNIWALLKPDTLTCLFPDEVLQKQIPLLFDISHIDPFNLHVDALNNIWISTNRGLGRIHPDGRQQLYSTTEGLPASTIIQIASDNENKIWLLTGKGIARLDPLTGNVVAFTDPLFSLPKVGTFGQALKTRDGKIIFTGIGGFVVIDPAKIALPRKAPKPYITAFDRGEQRQILPPDAPVVHLGKDERYCTFEFSAPDPIGGQQIRYEYYLEGHENSWLEAGNDHFVRYGNLSPGSYIFHIKAWYPDNQSQSQENQIMLVVHPAFYQTTGFKIGLIGLILGGWAYAIFMYTRSRFQRKMATLERKQQLETVRLNIAQDVHDEVGANLTKIIQGARILSQNPADEKSPVAQHILQSASQAIQSMREIVWTLNPKFDQMDSLLAYMRRYTTQFFEDTPVKCTFHFETGQENPAIDPQRKRQLLAILKESLHNIMKHAGANKLRLEFSLRQGNFTLQISDDGKGFDVNSLVADGNGLNNIRRRAAQLGDTCEIVSGAGEGTNIRIKGRLNQSLAGH